VKIEFKTDAIMLIPSCVLFRDAKGWAIGIGWLCWGTLIRFPNARPHAEARSADSVQADVGKGES
jgi:hypothetical protein